MHRLETISVTLFAVALVATPLIAWSLMMYRELEFTGQIIAALS
jgi:hypothetical protein